MQTTPIIQQEAKVATDTYEDSQIKVPFKQITEADNVAEVLEQGELDYIGRVVVEEYEIDEESRSIWMDAMEDALKMAMLIKEEKSYPWPNAANIKYPLITQGIMQFAARALPQLVSMPEPVRPLLSHKDSESSKKAATRVANHMSHQLLNQMEGWFGETDQALHILAACGCFFRKVYYDPIYKRPQSELVLPDNIVVNYYTKDLETCSRLTEKLVLTPNEIESKKRSGVYLDVNLVGEGEVEEDTSVDGGRAKNLGHVSEEAESLHERIKEKSHGDAPTETSSDPLLILEQHRFLDLDGDGYQEPYVVTVHKDTQKVLRIKKRFILDDIQRKDGKISFIKPKQFFVVYKFIPSFDGGFYPLGFGMLGSMNKAINTIINQLLDSGSFNNLSGGWFSKGLKLRGGVFGVRPNHWKQVESHGADLRKSILPYPTKEPSQVLFSLLGALVSAGEKVLSTTDPMMGQSPGADTAAGAIDTLVEQGMKVYNTIMFRQHSSFKREYKLLYDVNKEHLKEDFKFPLRGRMVTVKPEYYDGSYAIAPTTNASAADKAKEVSIAEKLYALSQQTGDLDSSKTLENLLKVMGIENADEFIIKPEDRPPTPPSPEQLIETAKAENEAKRLDIMRFKSVFEVMKLKADTLRSFSSAIKIIAESNVDSPAKEYSESIEMLAALKDSMNQDAGDLLGGDDVQGQFGEQGGVGGMEEPPINEVGGGAPPGLPPGLPR
jgi:chaperonin GroES